MEPYRGKLNDSIASSIAGAIENPSSAQGELTFRSKELAPTIFKMKVSPAVFNIVGKFGDVHPEHS